MKLKNDAKFEEKLACTLENDMRNLANFDLTLENLKICTLTHFIPLISFDTPWKHQKTRGFRMFSGAIKRDQWHEMG